MSLRTDRGRNDYRFSLSHAHPDRFIFTEEAFRFSSDEFETPADWEFLGSGHPEAAIVDAAQHGEPRDLLSEVHRLDAQPRLDALVRRTDHDSRLAHSSTAAQAALSTCEATSTTTPLGRCTRNAAPAGGMRTGTNVGADPPAR